MATHQQSNQRVRHVVCTQTEYDALVSSNDILERIITVGRYVLLYKKFYANKCTTTRIFETTFEGYIAAVANVLS